MDRFFDCAILLVSLPYIADNARCTTKRVRDLLIRFPFVGIEQDACANDRPRFMCSLRTDMFEEMDFLVREEYGDLLRVVFLLLFLFVLHADVLWIICMHYSSN